MDAELVQLGDVHRATFPVERRTQPIADGLWHRAAAVSPAGWCDSLDVAVTFPTGWAGLVSWRLIYRSGTVLHLAATGTFAAAGMLPLQGQLSGVVARLRGVHFEEAFVELTTATAGLDVGTVRIVSWARSTWPWGEFLTEHGEIPVQAEPQPSEGDLPKAAANSRVVLAVPALLEGLHAYNPNASDVWLLAWDAAAVPAAGTSSDFAPILLPAGVSGISVEWPSLELATGFAWATSSAADPYTVPGPATPIWVDTFHRAI